MYLHYQNGGGGKCALELDGRPRSTIGRASTCDLVIPEESVSRLHAAIERVAGQHVLQDKGSANGTFLNGLRLVRAHAFTLREGDVIEIGPARLVYGEPPQAEGFTGLGAPQEVRPDRSYSVATLLRDGAARFGGSAAAETQSTIQRTLESGERQTGIDRCLELVAKELGVDAVAIYAGKPSKQPELLAAFPNNHASQVLAPLVLRSWIERSARHGERALSFHGSSSADTSIVPRLSTLAVPFFRSEIGCIVAVERVSGKRFERVDLAHAAVLAERLARAIVIGSLKRNETPFC